MARARQTAAVRKRQAVNTYVDGNTVRKVQPKRHLSEQEIERRRLLKRREQRRIQMEREMEYRAQQERLRRKAIAVNKPYLFVLLVASTFTLWLCFSYIQIQTAINTRISSIDEKKQRLEQLRSENTELQNSIDMSVDLDEVYRVATQELGMVYAGTDQTITFHKTNQGYVRQYENIPTN